MLLEINLERYLLATHTVDPLEQILLASQLYSMKNGHGSEVPLSRHVKVDHNAPT